MSGILVFLSGEETDQRIYDNQGRLPGHRHHAPHPVGGDGIIGLWGLFFLLAIPNAEEFAVRLDAQPFEPVTKFGREGFCRGRGLELRGSATPAKIMTENGKPLVRPVRLEQV